MGLDSSPDDPFDNGILGQIPGEQIGAATKGLPDPETATVSEASTVHYVERVGGLVRFRFRLARNPRRGGRRFWAAYRADVIERADEAP